KQDIVNRVAEQLNITKVKAEIAVESVFNSLKNALKRGERIELRGFGVFIVKPRKSGVGRNPRTGEEVAIPPGKTIRFKPGKEIRADKIGIKLNPRDPHFPTRVLLKAITVCERKTSFRLPSATTRGLVLPS